ncbi:EF-hand domain-containing protein [Pontivivens insulae]|nr:histidine kinase [Pontivivens insulae]
MTKKTLLATALIAVLAAPVAFAQSGPSGFDFDVVDTNSDGELTADELNAFALARFEAQDLNDDGELDAEELSAAIAARAEERRTRGVERIIERADADGNGTLSADELGGRRSPEERIARLDTDDSGTISREEAEAASDDRRGNRGDRGDRGERGDRGGDRAAE